MIPIDLAWNIFLRNARSYHETGQEFPSPDLGNPYHIAAINNDVVRIERDIDTYDTVGRQRFVTAINKLNDAGGSLPKTAMITGPVICEATIVELLPGILEWIGERGGMRVIDLSVFPREPKEEPVLPQDLTIEDFRRQVARQVTIRLQQGRLRNELLYLYEERCAISDFQVLPVLQACHLIPFVIEGSQDSRNAILLKSDLHDLFDAHLLGIHPEYLTIRIAPSILETPYGDFNNVPLRPRRDGVLLFSRSLEKRWELFLDRQGRRE